MKNIELEQINNEVNAFVKERDWEQFHSVKNLAMALTVEASELLEIFQWLSEEQSNLAKNDPLLKEKIADEIADVFVYLLRITGKMDVDLNQAILNKLKKNAMKYPVELSKGNAKKYNEF